MSTSSVVIVDYGLGNLFSVKQALEKVGAVTPVISSDQSTIENAERLILPGVGAFGDGMNNLRQLDLVTVIKEYAASGRPILGVCLGMQLIMSESEEFGRHEGLDLIPGRVRLLEPGQDRRFKIPHIGWNSLLPYNQAPENRAEGKSTQAWQGTVLQSVSGGSFMYFVHSYVVEPEDPSVTLAQTGYGTDAFCSVLRRDNITGAQFHPELSGEDGLSIYNCFINGR